MQFAEREAVGNDGLASGVTVGQNVGGVEKLTMPQPANCTGVTVGVQHALTEGALVETTQRQHRHIAPSRFRDLVARGRCARQPELLIVNSDLEREL